MANTLTVTGYAGSIQTLVIASIGSPAYGDASSLLAAINASVAGGSYNVELPGSTATIPARSSGLLQVITGGLYAVPTGYSALVDSATTAATVFGGSANGQIVVAGSGGLTFNAGSGSGTVVAGDGANFISVLRGASAQKISTGTGSSTIVATSGNNDLRTGYGSNLILAQGGNDTIVSAGNDLISVPDGNASITLSAFASTIAPSNQVVFLGSGASQITENTSGSYGLLAIFDPMSPSSSKSIIVGGSGAATIAAQRSEQLWMQSGGGVINSTGYLLPGIVLVDPIVPGTTVTSGPMFTPLYVADTIIGGSGAVTVNTTLANDFVFAGAGALQFNGGTGASTILGNASGSATINGGEGSVVAIAYGQTRFTGGSGAATVAAFGSGVTINGGSGTGLFVGASVGGNVISGGAGSAVIYGGGGGDVLTAGAAGGIIVAGAGSETLIGGPGADLFAVIAGKAGNLVVQGFAAGQDSFTLLGFGAGEAATALAGAVTIAGSQQLTLSDGTKILFSGVTGLGASSFI